jgi:hypothetical protein
MATLREQMTGAPQQNQTSAVSRLMQAKAGNLATAGVGGGGPRQESVPEDTVNAEAEVAKAQQAQQQNLAMQGQAQQSEAQAQQAAQAQQTLASQEKQKMIVAANQANEILTGLEQGKQTLSFQEKVGLEESAATALRLSSEKYIAQIQETATKERITDMASAQEALINSQMEDMIDVLSMGISTKQLMQMDDQEFRRVLAKMNIADAKALADKKMHQASEAQKFGAINSMIGVGGSIASKKVGG